MITNVLHARIVFKFYLGFTLLYLYLSLFFSTSLGNQLRDAPETRTARCRLSRPLRGEAINFKKGLMRYQTRRDRPAGQTHRPRATIGANGFRFKRNISSTSYPFFLNHASGQHGLTQSYRVSDHKLNQNFYLLFYFSTKKVSPTRHFNYS